MRATTKSNFVVASCRIASDLMLRIHCRWFVQLVACTNELPNANKTLIELLHKRFFCSDVGALVICLNVNKKRLFGCPQSFASLERERIQTAGRRILVTDKAHNRNCLLRVRGFVYQETRIVFNNPDAASSVEFSCISVTADRGMTIDSDSVYRYLI